MKRRRLLLTPEHRRRLEASARSAAPEECCGVMLGHKPEADVCRVTRLVETENASASDRKSSYEIAPAELVAAWRQARATGEEILGFYHSHPGGGRQPSSHDALLAWSGMSYVIVAPGEETCDLTSWWRDGDAARPAERELGGIEGEGLEREQILVARQEGSA